MTADVTLEKSTEGTKIGLGPIDCDVHHGHIDGVWDLKPYIDKYWQARIGIIDPKGSGTGGSQGYQMPGISWLRMPGFPGQAQLRQDCVPPNGNKPGSDPAFMIEDLLDRYDLAAAILLGGDIRSIGGIPDTDLAAALAAAHNDWTAELWLKADPRFRGSITVAPRDTALAVKEIERWASHPGMIQILLCNDDGLMGKRVKWPIYEAAEHYGLPIAVHGGGEGAGINSPMTPLDAPTHFFEFHAGASQHVQARVISMVSEGVFEKFPKLQVVFVEAGFAWLPHVMWRMDKDWRSLRDEVPWIKRLPSEYVLENIRVTSQPMYEPPVSKHLDYMLEMMHADEMLLFATDYPHWDGDDPKLAMNKIAQATRDRILRGNAVDFYSRL